MEFVIGLYLLMKLCCGKLAANKPTETVVLPETSVVRLNIISIVENVHLYQSINICCQFPQRNSSYCEYAISVFGVVQCCTGYFQKCFSYKFHHGNVNELRFELCNLDPNVNKVSTG